MQGYEHDTLPFKKQLMTPHLAHESAAQDNIVQWIGLLLGLLQDVLKHVVGGLGAGGRGILALLGGQLEGLLLVVRVIV